MAIRHSKPGEFYFGIIGEYSSGSDNGFWKALQLRTESWQAYSGHDSERVQASLFCLVNLYGLATEGPDEETQEQDEKTAEIAPGLIPRAVQELHQARKDMYSFTPPAANENIARPGRNDPCPCGSGKKFKKCCLN